MKKKRFYNNKKRGTKWTEEIKGRKINFSDKYIDAGGGSDKFDNKRPTVRKPVFTRDNFEKLIKRLIVFVLCFAVFSLGYFIMDTHIIRNAMPEDYMQQDNSAEISSIDISIGATEIKPLAMDGGVMLRVVIDELQQDGYSSAMFDLKRNDGTISYLSKLATVETYGALSSPASDMTASAQLLIQNDVMPIARVCCYKDNIAPAADSTAALRSGKSLYKDSGGNTYLNPDSGSAYNYIKGIIEEAMAMGVTVFALDYCDLPDDISDDYNDGFEPLAKKLYSDLGEGIKLVEVKRIKINAKGTKAIQKELKEKTQQGKKYVYYITSSRKETVKRTIDKTGGINYIISE